MAYSMIVSSLISDFTGEEIYSQCFTIGPYLFGLGLGSYYFDKLSANNAIKKLWNLEFFSSLALPLYPILFNIYLFLYIGLSPGSMNLNDKNAAFFVIGFGSILSFLAGLLGGGQLPLILKASKRGLKLESTLAVNYLGPLLAGPFIVYLSSSATNYSIQSGLIGLAQFIGMLILIFKFDQDRKIRIVLLLLPLSVIIYSSKYYSKLEYLTAKATYLYPKFQIKDLLKLDNTLNFLEHFGFLERQRTPYQTIDIYTYEGSRQYSNRYTTYLYLNRRVQFNNNSSEIYHESMLYGALNLYGKNAENILILGGGDGILFNMIQKELPKSSTTLVELDEKMIESAKTNQFLKSLNENVFENIKENNKLIIGDAITYLRKIQNKRKFDLIFIDFPFPNGHELSKLYSKEFYGLVKNVSKKETLITIDLPLEMKNEDEFEEESLIILQTIYQAGFKKQIGYGPHSSFVSVSQLDNDLQFNYETLPKKISLAAKINLIPFIDHNNIEKLNLKRRVNSMFWPRRK